MTTSSTSRRRRWRGAVPLVLSVVFVLIAVLVVWRPFSGEPDPAAPTACESLPGDRTTTSDGVLKIGTIFPQTGRELGSTGEPLVAATEMAVRDVADAGGIPGLQPPQLGAGTELDEGAPGTATTCTSVSTLLAGGVDAIVGPYASVNTLPVLQRVTGAGRLMISPSNELSALSSVPDRGLFFRTAVPDAVQADVLTDLVAQEGNHNVAVVASQEPYASSLAGAITDRLRARAIPSTTLTYPDTDRFPGIADAVAAGRFDGVVFIGFREIAELVRILLDRGVNPQNHRLYGTSGFLQNTAAGLASPDALERLAGLRGFVAYADPAFNERLKAFRSGMQDLTYGAQAYDAVIAVSLAAAASRSDDPVKIAQELPQVTRGGQRCTSYQICVALLAQDPRADIDYDGVSGPLGFTPEGDPCQGSYLLSSFDTTGHLQSLRQGDSPNRCS